ncbi:C40 family peptidase [Companilactobacillus allii]|uniref:Glycoside hydrolase n=1 Tax=Companilactobacillus allii TaxID=1847728 RepID=A0A1P8Q180_9LACO|nr:C40 family peptidase [Companilactobacillus allii]APX71618.1 glycoside hydrolase [Companilactobacillus allii]USQ68700.1 C40 family peptidase [Companilactobacillus allii]
MNNKVKKSLISFTAAASLAVTGLGVSNATTTHAATTVAAPSAVTTSSMTLLYSTPSASAKTVGRALAANTSWAVGKAVQDDSGNTFYYVATNEWVKASDVTDSSAVTEAAADTTTTDTTTDNSQSSVDSVISTAKQYLGTPYVWGGKTPSGFDCSGFTSYVFQQATGKSIGSYTVAQESAGTKEAVSQASAGDLLFWGGQGSSYHVAIYLGNNQYIAAPQPGQSVKISSISGYFMPSFAVKVL